MRKTIVLAAVLLVHAGAAVGAAKPRCRILPNRGLGTAFHHPVDGRQARRVDALDGSRWRPDGRESFVLRGQVFETDSASHVGSDGLLDRVDIRGFTPNGDAAESFVIAGGRATWKSPVDGGSAAYTSPALYVAFAGPSILRLIWRKD